MWLAGEDGAEAGLAMPATPRVGDGWRAAYDADVVDVRMTVETRDHVADTPAGTYSDLLGLDITDPLEPDAARRAFYERGVGLVEETSTDGPVGIAELQSARHASSSSRSLRWAELGGLRARVRLRRLLSRAAWAAARPWAGPVRRAGVASEPAVRPVGCRGGLRPAVRLPLLERLPLLSGVVPLPAVLDDRLLLPRGLVLGGLLLVPLLLVLVGRAVAGHRGRAARAGRRSAPSRRTGLGAVAEEHRVGEAGDRAAEQRGRG